MDAPAKDLRKWTSASFAEAVEFHRERVGRYGWQLGALKNVQAQGERTAHRREKWLKRLVNQSRPYFLFEGPLGLQFFGDFRDRYSRHAFLHIEDELPLASLLVELLNRKPGVLLDVGANMGILASLVARQMPDRRVFSVEAEPETARRAAANFGVNGLVNASLIHAAASDAAGEIVFYSPAGKSESASVVKQEGKRVNEIRMPAVRVDQLGLDGDPVSVVKFDVEGHEPAAIRGAVGILKEFQPAVVFEYHWEIAPKLGWTVADIEAILSDCGHYKFRAWEGEYPPKPGEPEIANIIATVD